MSLEAGKTTLRSARPEDYDAYAELFRELGVDEASLPYERFCTEMLPTTVVAEDGGQTLADWTSQRRTGFFDSFRWSERR